MTKTNAPVAEGLRELLAKAPKGPWEVEAEHDADAEYGPGPDPDRGFDDFIVFDSIGQLLLSTATSDAKCIVEEPYGDEDGYKQAWDETGKATADLIVAAVNALPGLLAHIDEQATHLAEARRVLEAVVELEAPAEHATEPLSQDLLACVDSARSLLSQGEER